MMPLRRLTIALCLLWNVAVAQTDWPMYGHDPGALRYSPLKQIDTKNVSRLRVAWTFDTQALVSDRLKIF